jgi:hypothetical protein
MSAPHWIVTVTAVWAVASVVGLWWLFTIANRTELRCNCGQFPLDPDEAMWTTTLLHRPDVCAPHREVIA